jgi:hypothetical protein
MDVCTGFISGPQNSVYLETKSVILFGNRVFGVKMRSYRIRVGSHYDWYP